MKKGSAAAAQPLSQFSRQKLTMGLDLGDRFSYYCVLDENGELVRQDSEGANRPFLAEQSTFA